MKGWSWLLMAAAVLSSAPSFGSCVGSSREVGQPVGYDKIFIDTSSLPSSIRSYVGPAANFWNSDSCNPPIAGAQYTFEFPILSVDYSQGANRNVDVIYRTGFNPSNDTSCGNFAGNTLTLYEKARRDGMPLTCTQGPLLTDTITHEFGHLLGLVDQYGSECNTYIMSQAGFTSSGSYVDRTLHSSECQKVAACLD